MLRTALTAIILAAASSSVLAEIKLSPIFTDHMVLQRGVACPVWGTAKAGEKVEITVDDGKTVSTVANDKGFFRAKLPVLAEGKPLTLTVKAGDDTVKLSDVLVGDVWVCSGQSNMQWSVWDSKDRDNEVKNANHPNIRLYYVTRKTSDEPVDTLDAQWQVCSPETIGGFSAVSYFFGRHLNQELDVPIGLIHTSWGGTIAEAWTPDKYIQAMSDMAGVAELSAKLKESKAPDFVAKQVQIITDWSARAAKNLETVDEAHAAWKNADFDDAAWQTLATPGDWTKQGVPNGLGWMRKTVELPADLAGKDLTLSLGIVDDFDVTYFNGEKVGDVLPAPKWNFFTARNYTVPGKLVKAGKNVIAVHVLDTGGAGGIYGPADAMKLAAADRSGAPIALAGDWKVISEKAIDPKADPRPNNAADPNNPNMPSRLYNAMIYPLHDFGIKGAIWYQGESNAERYGEYERLLSTMITSWREQFGVGEFPFYIVGLANFMAPTDDANKQSNWAHLREAQRQVSRNLKNTGMSVTIDIGEEKDIHPKNKQDVGKRLAMIALKDTYGKEIVSRGPTLKSVSFDGPKTVLSFDNVGGGLVAKEGLAQSFSLAGEDGKFVWADATIEGDKIVLTAKDVTSPTLVRYAFADNPKATLFNKEGLPAEPFEAKK